MSGLDCPACGHTPLEVFHTQSGVPVNSCLLVDTQAEAERFPRGDLRLGFCPECGFIANTAFDPSRAEYSQRYEETQGFSAHFRAFASELAQRWIDRYDIHGRDVLEIGCGKGEFLALMCEQGGNRGVGIDPSAIPGRLVSPAADRIRLLPEVYDERWADVPADVVVCRHTLEHIAPVQDFMQMVRRTIGERTDTVVLFELPDVARVLREIAFEDVYYEHCSYFSVGSLVRLFRRTGFEVLSADLVFDGQYVVVEARPGTVPVPARAIPGEDDLEELAQGVAGFRGGYQRLIQSWRDELAERARSGGRTAIWGSGSKAVSYLTALGAGAAGCAVDINPYKQGKYLAGAGLQVSAPAALVDYDPDLVVAMNAVYVPEIQGELDRLGVTAELVTLDTLSGVDAGGVR